MTFIVFISENYLYSESNPELNAKRKCFCDKFQSKFIWFVRQSQEKEESDENDFRKLLNTFSRKIEFLGSKPKLKRNVFGLEINIKLISESLSVETTDSQFICVLTYLWSEQKESQNNGSQKSD